MKREPSESQEESEQDPYKLVESGPAKKRALADDDETPPLLPASIAAYPQRKRAAPAAEELEDEFSLARDRIVPIILIIVGFGLRLAQIPMETTHDNSVGAAIAMGVCQIIVTTAIMLGGVFLSAYILSINFGRLDSAVLKLFAMAIMVWAAGAFAMALGAKNPFVGRFAICLIFLVQIAFFSTLFKLEAQEMMLTVAICGFIEALATLVMFNL